MQDSTSRTNAIGPSLRQESLDDSFFLLWRSILDKPHFADPNLLKVWVWCLAKASYKPRCIYVKTGRGSTTVTLQRGQFLYGRKAAAHELQMPEGSVRDRMQKLRELDSIAIQPDTHFSIITVVNFDAYQPSTSNRRQATRHPTDTQEPGNRQATDTNKEGHKARRDQRGRRFDDIDGAMFLVQEKRSEVLRLIQRIARKVRRHEPRDRSLVVKAAILQSAGQLAENDIQETLESFDHKRPDNSAKWFHECLDDKAARYGERLNRMLASVKIDAAEIDAAYRDAMMEN
jgi:hypothetical protein